MNAQFRPALVSFLALTVVTGIAYPLLVTAVAQIAFPSKANGGLLIRGGKAVGSERIGQPFHDAKYFWSRPSATSPVPYTAFNAETLTGSSGSNLGPTNPALFDAVKARVEDLRRADPESHDDVPIDLVTASGSGLDPDISVAAAAFQVRRVAKARAMEEAAVGRLVAEHTERRFAGILGEPVVHVLQLNLALDDAAKDVKSR